MLNAVQLGPLPNECVCEYEKQLLASPLRSAADFARHPNFITFLRVRPPLPRKMAQKLLFSTSRTDVYRVTRNESQAQIGAENATPRLAALYVRSLQKLPVDCTQAPTCQWLMGSRPGLLKRAVLSA